MFYFSSLASHCEGVDMSSAASAWVPLRDGLFACFSAFTSCVTAFTEGLRQRVQAAAAAAAAAGGGASFGRRLNKSIRWGIWSQGVQGLAPGARLRPLRLR